MRNYELRKFLNENPMFKRYNWKCVGKDEQLYKFRTNVQHKGNKLTVYLYGETLDNPVKCCIYNSYGNEIKDLSMNHHVFVNNGIIEFYTIRTLDEMKSSVHEILGRLHAQELDGVKLIFNCMFYSLFECEGKEFFILNDVWSGMDHPFTNKEIRDDAENYGLPFEMWNGENYELIGIPCLGTHFYLQEVHCWDYKEVSRLGWTKSFYRKVVKALYKRFDGYYGFNANEDVFEVENYVILKTFSEEKGGYGYTVYGPGTDICEDRLMRMYSRKDIEFERKHYEKWVNGNCTNDEFCVLDGIDEDLPFN